MRILLAIDDSAGSRAAIEEVARRPWPANSSIVVLTAYELRLGPMTDSWLAPRNEQNALKAERDHAQALVDATVDKLRAKTKGRLTIIAKTLQGSPEQLILEEADRSEVDLIVLGSHGHRAWERLILGAVAHTVALHAPCSVEIVRRRKRRPAVLNKEAK